MSSPDLMTMAMCEPISFDLNEVGLTPILEAMFVEGGGEQEFATSPKLFEALQKLDGSKLVVVIFSPISWNDTFFTTNVFLGRGVLNGISCTHSLAFEMPMYMNDTFARLSVLITLESFSGEYEESCRTFFVVKVNPI